MLKEFMAFINRGNVVDLAVAVIIGGAFGAITTSLVNEVVMPVLGLIIGGVDFQELGFILADRHLYSTVSEAVAAGAPVIQIGSFINTIVNFLIIAFVIFMVIRSYTNIQKRFARKAEVPVETTPELTVEQKLLIEIRDLLRDSRP